MRPRVAAVIVLAIAGCTGRNLEPTPRDPVRPPAVVRPAPELRPVDGTEGVARETTLLVLPLQSMGARLEVRTISINQTDSVALPTQSEAALEVRSGDVETVVDGARQSRYVGEMFMVGAGSRLTIRVIGEQAVLRGVYLVRVP